MGPIHLRFQKLTDASIMFGAPIHANLLVHEATHRYAKTVDATVNVPSEGKKLAYFNVFRGNVLATYTAAERVMNEKHWASDVTFGAVIGVLSGRTVTRHLRGGGRVTLGARALPGGGEVVVHVVR